MEKKQRRMHYSYWIESDELWVWDNSRNAVFWHGKPSAETVLQVLAVPGHDDCLVLLDFQAGLGSQMYGLPRNLARVHPDGAIAWQRGGPDTAAADPFTAFEWLGEELNAFSWSCHLCIVDVETGEITSSLFTK